MDDRTSDEILASIRALEERQKSTLADRELLRSKLRSFTESIDLTSNLAAKDIEATVTALNAYNSVLNDIDKQPMDLAKLMLSRKKQDNESSTSGMIAEFLYKLNTSPPTSKAPTHTDADIVNEYEAHCDPIKDTELI